MGTSFLRAQARSVLTCNRIDLTGLQVGIYGEVLRLQGMLRRSPGLPKLTMEGVESLEWELRRIRGIRRVEMQLHNWRRVDGTWSHKPLSYSLSDTPAEE